MGRILDVLKQLDKQRLEHEEPTFSHTTEQPEPAAEANEAADEVPYIEVGPHKSMEGSPSVLASKPPPDFVSFAMPRLVVPEADEEEAEEEEELPLPRRKLSDDVPPARTQAPSASDGATHGHTSPKRQRGDDGDPVARAPGLCDQPRMALDLIAYHQPEHAMSRQYEQLITPLLGLTPGVRSHVLLFTAARPGCGTTTMMLNVAISAARQPRLRVVVVEGNLRRPALAQKLGLGEVSGLRDVLAGRASLEQSLQETDQLNLFALTAGSSRSTSGIRAVAETMRSVLRQLRQRFDLVLVDGPRWDGQPDVVLLGTACDGIYLVVPENEAESTQVDSLYQTIPESGGRLAGCILTGA